MKPFQTEHYYPRGDHAVLVFHGMAGSPKDMEGIVNAMTSRGLSVYSPLFTFHGKNSIKELKSADYREWVRDAESAYLHIKEKHRKVSACGFCLGVPAAILLADKFDITGISLLSPVIFLDGWNIPKYAFLLPLILNTPLKRLISFKLKFPFSLKSPILQRGIRQMINNDPQFILNKAAIPAVSVYQYRRMVCQAKNVLPGIISPLLIIQAREDDVCSPGNTRWISANIGSSIIKILFLENSYHLIIKDQERKKVEEETAIFHYSL